MFQESCVSLPIRRSGAISELKMTANSTYWKAKLRFNRYGVTGKRETLLHPLNGRPGAIHLYVERGTNWIGNPHFSFGENPSKKEIRLKD